MVAHGVVHQDAGLQLLSGEDKVDAEIESGKDAQQGDDHIHDLGDGLTAVQQLGAERVLHPGAAVAQEDQQDGAGHQDAALEAAAGAGVAVEHHIAAKDAGQGQEQIRRAADDDVLFAEFGFHASSSFCSGASLSAFALLRRMTREPAMAAIRMKLSPMVS